MVASFVNKLMDFDRKPEETNGSTYGKNNFAR